MKHLLKVILLLVLGVIGVRVSCTQLLANSKTNNKNDFFKHEPQLSFEVLRNYLHYYSPVIFKQADESTPDSRGRDLLSNFFYDNDSVLSNNKENWTSLLSQQINLASQSSWKIDPTIYSSIILFEDKSLNTHSAILLYHIYHPMQYTSIHDWERIEIRVDDVSGKPGIKEKINYVTITRHSLHDIRRASDDQINFINTPFGKHVLIWQASWNLGLGTSQGELRFVESKWKDINLDIWDNKTAKVDINGANEQNYHYVFVDQADSYLKKIFKSKSITRSNLRTLNSGRSKTDTVNYSDVKSINYYLQDIADILPTHLDSLNWKNGIKINIVDPVINEDGNIEIDRGVHTFYTTAKDVSHSVQSRKGYIKKHWFWGVYVSGVDGDNFYSVLDPQPWYQHCYFAHNGKIGDGSMEYEVENCGIFLGKDDYKSWNLNNKGFDGRWYQLFKDI
ncbi:MAG: hypothetical protein ACOYJK_10440 [Prevotella sp.]|jgi:hypothetical protein